MKRTLYLLHRWAGVVLCAFMAMWFASGIVMMYVGYPKLTRAERLLALPPLDAACCTTLAKVLADPRLGGHATAVRLTSIGGAPRYVVATGQGQSFAFDAASGRPAAPTTPATALAAARSLAGRVVEYDARLDEDAWTHSRGLDGHRPLHRVRTADGALYYVSSATGEVVRDATRTERIWNWAGAWIHWLYPFRGGAVDACWHDIVVWTSVAGTLLALTGLAVGVLRWRFRRPYRIGTRTPFRERFMRWHHVAGLLFGTFVATWVFSGLMSMNPWRIFTSGAKRPDVTAFTGGDIDATHARESTHALLVRFAAHGFVPREIEWRRVGGRGYVVASDARGRTLVQSSEAAGEVRGRIDERELLAAAARLLPGARIASVERLAAYDFYYYARAAHTMTGDVERRLPLLRVRFDDARSTWAHIDPRAGTVTTLDARRRAERWLFALPHSFDWLPLLERRPLWDCVLLALSAGGLAISVTGIVIGWRRSARKLRSTAASPR